MIAFQDYRIVDSVLVVVLQKTYLTSSNVPCDKGFDTRDRKSVDPADFRIEETLDGQAAVYCSDGPCLFSYKRWRGLKPLLS